MVSNVYAPRPPRTVSTRVTAVAAAAGKHGSWKSQQYNTLSNKATKPTIQHLALINFLVFRIGSQTLCFIFGPRQTFSGGQIHSPPPRAPFYGKTGKIFLS